MASASFENLPANISSKFESYCTGCETRQLEIVESTEIDEWGISNDISTIKCKWRTQCKHLFRQLERRNE